VTYDELVGGLQRQDSEGPFPGSHWYACSEIDAGFEYRFPAGELAEARWLTADLLLDATDMAAFRLILREGSSGPEFEMIFALLPQCSARMRMPLSMLSQAKWRYEREGAWLKPMARGGRVDPAKVDRMILEVHRKSDAPLRFAMTPLDATDTEPELLDKLTLPKGKLLDRLGQSAIREWPGKTANEEELIDRLRRQAAEAGDQKWPDSFSPWGGWVQKQYDATGFFRTHHDGSRWWLVDPDGCAFWSTGPDCVHPEIDASIDGLEEALEWMPDRDLAEATAGRLGHERRHINYLGINLRRAFGEGWHEEWKPIILAELRRIGFNTVANWSEWQMAKEAEFPYVRHLDFRCDRAPLVYRDLPDVYDSGFALDAAAVAAQLTESVDDPALIGYFLMNEPTWGFSAECPAAGMLYTYESGPARDRFARFLKEKYRDDDRLAESWGPKVSFSAITSGLFDQALTDRGVADCEEFSAEMVSRFFTTLTQECRKIDPHHLNLGIRYQTVPPHWALDGMRTFDVFSMNCYRDRVPSEVNAEIARLLGMPVMIGEWHFGALDAGLPASGIGHVRSQTDRGKAYRYYLETAAADPNCVGVHYFTLYDQSAIGRFDGEAYQIGFIDGCHRRYPEMCGAARATHEAMYEVADGSRPPFGDLPEYLPKLFV
jgi:hypothetical protein